MKKINKNNAIEIVNLLKSAYPDATCSLNFKTPFQLVIAVMLSAQCTDERVNKTTPILFKKYPTIKAFVNSNLTDLETIIHPCGFYKNKAKNAQLCAKQIIENFNGQVPQNISDLQTLAGIGRKSANVIMLEAFNNPQGIAIDTHAKRIANLTELSKQSEPEKIEKDLINIFPKETLKDVNHLLVWHGRKTCIARKPNCDNCCIKHYCNHFIKKEK